MEFNHNLIPTSQLPDNFMSGELVSNSSFSYKFSNSDIADILNNEVVVASEDHWHKLDSLGDTPIEIFGKLDACESNSTEDVKPLTVFAYTNGSEMKHVESNLSSIGNRNENHVPNTHTTPSLSLFPWNGEYDFSIEVQSTLTASSKWRYSNSLKKLYLRPSESVPIEIRLLNWIEGHINITPVFTSSAHTSKPVARCYNHKQEDIERNILFPDHIVQVENPEASYRCEDSRFSVDVPMRSPPPGEETYLVYVKCGCLSSCAGGPYRKPFCLVFTLFNSLGTEVGRQILDLKVCACPIRDCENKEMKYMSKNNSEDKKLTTATHKKPVRVSKSTKKLKLEVSRSYEQISIPKEIAGEVKRYANQLMAEKYAKENNVPLLFPGY